MKDRPQYALQSDNKKIYAIKQWFLGCIGWLGKDLNLIWKNKLFQYLQNNNVSIISFKYYNKEAGKDNLIALYHL